MKILHVSPYYFPAVRYGGPIRSVHGLCKALVVLGHDVSVFTTSIDGVKNLDYSDGDEVKVDGVKVTYFKVRFLRRIFFSYRMFKALKTKIKNSDVIHLHTLYTCPTLFAAVIARKYGTPYVVSTRGMLIQDLIQLKNSFIKKIWICFFEKKNLEKATCVHVTSSLEEESVKSYRYNLSAIELIPNGIDSFNESKMHISSEIQNILNQPRYGNFIFYLGRIDKTKRIRLLIETLVEIRNVALLIAGNDEKNMICELKAHARDLGVLDRIVFLGGVNDVEKEVLLKRATLLALPSYAESFGLVVLEAMASKCPVVVAESVGIAPVVQQSGSGFVVEANVKSFLWGINKILENKDESKIMGEQGAEWVRKNHSWDFIANSFVDVYHKALVKKEANSCMF